MHTHSTHVLSNTPVLSLNANLLKSSADIILEESSRTGCRYKTFLLQMWTF